MREVRGKWFVVWATEWEGCFSPTTYMEEDEKVWAGIRAEEAKDEDFVEHRLLGRFQRDTWEEVVEEAQRLGMEAHRDWLRRKDEAKP